ncbi:putative transposase like protein [Trichonephila clavipes]|nr:putative transposase like protein [Trichonephila clavipes]
MPQNPFFDYGSKGRRWRLREEEKRFDAGASFIDVALISVSLNDDESTFEILQNKAQFVRRHRGQKFHSDCVVQTVKHPTKIMIWSVISGKAGTMVSKCRTIHFYARWSSPCHTARSIKAFLAEQNIPLLDWLGNSPVKNTIENVWELMIREVDTDVITNKTQLLERIIQVWSHHPQMQETVQSCVLIACRTELKLS